MKPVEFNHNQTMEWLEIEKGSVDPLDVSGQWGKFLRKKREWEAFPFAPIQMDQVQNLETLQRCLVVALYLEIPVGYFTNAASYFYTRDEDDALAHNSFDELNHYNGFKFASEAYGVPQNLLDEFQPLQDELLKIASEEEFVLLSGYLELTIFFVTLAMMRKYGEDQLKNLSRYVSRDESCHVNVNYNIIDKYGLTFTNPDSVENLRKSILRFLTADLDSETSEFWYQQSDNLKETRKAPDLDFTKVGMMPKMFEMPAY